METEWTSKAIKDWYDTIGKDIPFKEFIRIRPDKDRWNGPMMYGKNTIKIYQDGLAHNAHGPAVVIIAADTHKIIAKFYYINNRVLKSTDILCRMIMKRDRDASRTTNDD